MRKQMILVAAAMGVAACSSPPLGPHRFNESGASSAYLEIAGRVSVSRSGTEYTVDLTSRDGMVVRLIGNQVAMLASLDQAEVLARGAWESTTENGDGGIPGGPDRAIVPAPDASLTAASAARARFIVYEFEVTSVQGRLALDGVLELTTDGYALRLANGEVRLVTGCPDSIAEYVGMRLWVVGSEDDPPVVFGLIAAI